MAILSLGTRLAEALKAAEDLAAYGISTTVTDARFAKPLDVDLISRLARNHEVLITVEEGSVGGFGSFVTQALLEKGLLDGRRPLKLRSMVLPDVFLDHDKPEKLYTEAHLDAKGIVAKVLEDARPRGRGRAGAHRLVDACRRTRASPGSVSYDIGDLDLRAQRDRLRLANLIDREFAVADANVLPRAAPFGDVARHEMFVEGRLARPSLGDVNETRLFDILGVGIFEATEFFPARCDHFPHGGSRLRQTLGRNSHRTDDQQHGSLYRVNSVAQQAAKARPRQRIDLHSPDGWIGTPADASTQR